MIFDEYLIKSKLTEYESDDYPGLKLINMHPLYESPVAFHMVVDTLVQSYLEADITHVAAIEPFGVPVGSVMAYALAKPLVIINNKSSALTAAKQKVTEEKSLCLSNQYQLRDSRVLLVDDIVRTGATLSAASVLITGAGGKITDAACIVAISEYGGIGRASELDINLRSIIVYQG